jgi:hypothetical protein
MPAPLPNDQWSCSMLSTTEAKVPEAIHRRLGYHVKPEDKSMLEYSRYAPAAPLEWMRKVVQSIRESRLALDSTRLGRWKAGWSLQSQTEPLQDRSGADASQDHESAVAVDESCKNWFQETPDSGLIPEGFDEESFDHADTPEARHCDQSPASDDEEFFVPPFVGVDPGSPTFYQPEGQSDDEGFEKVSAASGSVASSHSDEAASDPPSSNDEPVSKRVLEALAPAWPQDRLMSSMPMRSGVSTIDTRPSISGTRTQLKFLHVAACSRTVIWK